MHLFFSIAIRLHMILLPLGDHTVHHKLEYLPIKDPCNSLYHIRLSLKRSIKWNSGKSETQQKDDRRVLFFVQTAFYLGQVPLVFSVNVHHKRIFSVEIFRRLYIILEDSVLNEIVLSFSKFLVELGFLVNFFFDC